MSKRRLTRACYEARAWLTGVANARDDFDALGRLSLLCRSLSGEDLVEARESIEALLGDDESSELNEVCIEETFEDLEDEEPSDEFEDEDLEDDDFEEED